MYAERVYNKIFIRRPLGIGKEVSFIPTEKTADALRLWSSALTRGTYKQGRMRLNYCTSVGIYRFCCLGVLGAENNLIGDAMFLNSYQFKKILALESYRNFQYFFAYLNDEKIFSFDKIADILNKLAAFLNSSENVLFF